MPPDFKINLRARQKAFAAGKPPLEKPVVGRWISFSVPMIEVEEVLLIERLASSDLSLGFYYQHLQLEKNPDFQAHLKAVMESRNSSSLSAELTFQGGPHFRDRVLNVTLRRW